MPGKLRERETIAIAIAAIPAAATKLLLGLNPPPQPIPQMSPVAVMKTRSDLFGTHCTIMGAGSKTL